MKIKVVPFNHYRKKAVFISDKAYFKAKNITNDKGRHFIIFFFKSSGRDNYE